MTYKFRWRDPDGNLYFKTFTAPNDAAQLIGTDWNGKEIYEGDILIDQFGQEWRATAAVRLFNERNESCLLYNANWEQFYLKENCLEEAK